MSSLSRLVAIKARLSVKEHIEEVREEVDFLDRPVHLLRHWYPLILTLLFLYR